MGAREARLSTLNQRDREFLVAQPHSFKFRQLPDRYAIVHLPPDLPIPGWATRGAFTSITRTDEELSIVCLAEDVPSEVHSPHRWICLKLEGPFPFSLTGILLSFINPLSNNKVPIFAISTYDTDYVLIQEEHRGVALDALQKAGHELIDDPRSRLNKL